MNRAVTLARVSAVVITGAARLQAIDLALPMDTVAGRRSIGSVTLVLAVLGVRCGMAQEYRVRRDNPFHHRR